jgi:hypothetical protein
MIENIYLHIGFHKTGTSTIQQSFGESRKYLAQNGFLYPVFRMKGHEVFNHSIPIVSMFCTEPEKYSINIKNGITTKEAAEKLNQSYDQQFKEQIQNFDGHTLLISGEDISGLSLLELGTLRQYLISITNPEVIIKILIVIRHPISWEKSWLQQMLKSGKSMNSIIKENATLKIHRFISNTEKFKIAFQQDSILMQRYEDLSDNANGLFAGFILGFQILEREIEFVKNKYINLSITHEGAAILSAIYEKFPVYEDSSLEPLYRMFSHNFFFKTPGVKFQISEKECDAVWVKYHNAINNLCQQNNLPVYTYRCNFQNNDQEKWGDAATDYLTVIIPKLPEEIIPAVLGVLLTEIEKFGKSWPLKKKLHIFALVMFFSKYFQTNSRRKKAHIVIQETGLLYGLMLMTGYIIFKAWLIKPFEN